MVYRDNPQIPGLRSTWRLNLTPASNLWTRRRLCQWKLIRREIHMKRMTLLTVLALVFSLFTVTAAIAGPGPGTGEGDQDRDCRVVDGMSDCDFDQDRIQAKTNAPDVEQPQTKEQAQNQNQYRYEYQNQVGECQAEDCPTEDAPMTQEQIRERVMTRILEMLGAESAEVEGQYRFILNLMLQNMLRFRVLFI